MIISRISEIEDALTRTLEREGASSEHGCSALANVLLTALVKCRRDPRVTAAVSEEMRRLAAKLNELAATEVQSLEKVLSEARVQLH